MFKRITDLVSMQYAKEFIANLKKDVDNMDFKPKKRKIENTRECEAIVENRNIVEMESDPIVLPKNNVDVASGSGLNQTIEQQAIEMVKC